MVFYAQNYVHAHTLGKSWDNFVKILYFLKKKSHYFLKMSELFAHFENKMEKIPENVKNSPKFSHDLRSVVFILSWVSEHFVLLHLQSDIIISRMNGCF